MALQRFVVTATILIWALEVLVLAYPQASDLKEVQKTYPRTLSGVVQQISEPTNSTNVPPPPPAPIGAIECFTSGRGRQPTDVRGCRPTLNYFRTFPNYRRIQDFIEDRCPKNPYKPPYAVHQIQSNCAIQIASGNPQIVDNFSFEQARALAMEILEVCQDHGGHGGYAPIGHGVGWAVSVIGYSLPPAPPEPSGLPDQVGLGNVTSVPVMIVEA